MKKIFCFGLILAAGSWTPILAQMALSLSPSVPSPAPLGTVVTWAAKASNSQSGTLWYRFRIRFGFGQFHTVVDYGPKSSLDWASIRSEGIYEIEAAVRNLSTGETAVISAPFELTSRVSAGAPVITATANPLVWLYSAPECPRGSRVRVQFQSPEGFAQATQWQSCKSGYTVNFYLAGMRANTPYTVQQTIDSDGSLQTGPQLMLTTGDAGAAHPAPAVMLTPRVPLVNGILLQSQFYATTATDLSGNVVWYYPGDITFLTRPQTGGTFLGIGEDGAKDSSQQFIREFDVAGITLKETNAARINEQLASMSMHSVTAFHHEARKLPDGKYLVLAGSERILTDVQGPGPVDVIGDTILVLDHDLQLVWGWDAFDHLDPHRTAPLGENCTYPAGLGCAPFYLASSAKDWLHGNSLQLTPDGNLLYSVRHQDWLVKIDYENGDGGGNILWRMGKDGDFRIVSTDPHPWFSHQHDAKIEPDGTTLMLFDNGNTRVAADPAAHSRGQVLRIDERNRTVTPLLNADLGEYSYALGSAERLANGDYHFDSGATMDPAGSGSYVAHSLEVNSSGSLVYGIQFGALEYRTFRMRDLYTAP